MTSAASTTAKSRLHPYINDRSRKDAPVNERVIPDGKHLSLAGEPFRVRGVTYGSFAPRLDGDLFPEPTELKRDLVAIQEAGFNVVRTYTLPPEEMLDVAAELGLRILVGLDYRDWRYESETGREVQRRVLEAGRHAIEQALDRCAERPEILAIAVGNEVPADVVRVHGRAAVEDGLSELVQLVHDGDPGMLATYCSFPTTEFLEVKNQDLACFNVFLEDPDAFRRYMRHLLVATNDLPLVITELGLAGAIHGDGAQAESLDWQLRIVDESGCAGATIYAWTDEWAVDGRPVEGWGFGLTTAARDPKPALSVAADWARTDIHELRPEWPRISIVVCAYNAADYLKRCLKSVKACTYPNLELIVCNDGSTDGTSAIARRFADKNVEQPHGGLGASRNAGIQAATGEIVAFLDADAFCHPDWPFYIALALEDDGVVGTGGPNLPVTDVEFSERVVAQSPGGPIHVLTSNDRAEHVPGCNMAFAKWALEEIGGFDPIYTSAGDDVDVCWKLLDRGYQISFSPAAQVNHHRRDSIRGYLRQQRGYGRAEALVSARHRNRFNRLGQARWSGFIYGGPRMLPSLLRPIVYHGYFGDAPYQPITVHRAELLRMWSTATVPLVALIALIAVVLGTMWEGAWLVAAAAGAALLAHFALVAAGVRVSPDEPAPLRYRLAVAAMHVAQPMVRVIGRMRRIPTIRKAPTTEWTGDRGAWLQDLRERLANYGCAVRVAEPDEPWDLTVNIGPLLRGRITAAVLWKWTPVLARAYRPRAAGWVAGVAAVVVAVAALPTEAGAIPIAVVAAALLAEGRILRSRVRRAIADSLRPSFSALCRRDRPPRGFVSPVCHPRSHAARSNLCSRRSMCCWWRPRAR